MSETNVQGRVELGASVVEEVRAIREAIDEEVGGDIARLAERARRVGDEYRRRRGISAGDTEGAKPSTTR